MNKQMIIFDIIYIVIMLIGFVWCWPYSKSLNVLFPVLIGSMFWATISYAIYFIYKIIDRKGVLKKVLTTANTVVVYLPYIYLIVILLNAFVGMVKVFVFKDFIYSYTFFSALTVCHATKMVLELIEDN